MTEHELKTWPEYFQAIVENRKPFEYRLNDRGYEVGDVLWLREFVPAPPDDENNGPNGETGGHYTGRELRKSVTYILDDRLGPTMREGFVVMGIADDETARLREMVAQAWRIVDACGGTFDSNDPRECGFAAGLDAACEALVKAGYPTS